MSDARQVSLTFEAGGDPEIGRSILAALRAAAAPATIFLDGLWAETHPSLVREMAADAHELGNHGYSHPDFTELTETAMADELARTEAVAEGLVGRTTRPWFRPPFQAIDARVRTVAEQEGYRCLCRDAFDGAHWIGRATVQAVADRTMLHTRTDPVATYHLGSPVTAAALPPLIELLRADHVELCTLSALRMPPTERGTPRPELADLTPDPGYLVMRTRVSPPQMVNLVTLGTRNIAVPFAAEAIGEVGGVPMAVVALDRPAAVIVPGAAMDRHLVVLAGESTLELMDSENRLVAWIRARSGDDVQVPAGCSLRTAASGTQRAVALCIG